MVGCSLVALFALQVDEDGHWDYWCVVASWGLESCGCCSGVSVCLPQLVVVEGWSGCCLMVLGCGCLWWQVLVPSLEQETHHQHTSTWKSGYYSLQNFIISHMPFLICRSTMGYLFMSLWIHLTSTHFASNNAPCRPNQGLVEHGLCAVQIHHRLAYTPLAPYHYTLHPSKTKGGCFRAGNMEHLSHLRPRALLVDVSRLPSPPAVPPWHWCGSQYVRCGMSEGTGDYDGINDSPFTVTEETGGRSVCSGGSHKERWLWTTR